MRQFITLLAICMTANSFAQTCTITGFDVCTGPNPVTSFTATTLVSGTALTVGALYKVHNITTASSPTGALDAIVSIDAVVNANLISLDDDIATDETSVANTQAALLSPRIQADIALTNVNRRGYVQFTVRFYHHNSSNNIPANPISVDNLNFLHFDMDGFPVGTNGHYKEIGYVKKASATSTTVANYGAVNTELTTAGTVTDAGGSWLLTYGSLTERTGVSRCAEVVEKTVYSTGQSSVTFRMGYDYKAPVPYANTGGGQPTRQYGSKFGCFSLPQAIVLPVNLTSLTATERNGVVKLNWTSEQEVNVDNYEVYRSTDRSSFTRIGSVSATGNGNAQSYNFNDNTLPKGAAAVYYKLLIKDRDGKEKYSNIVSIRLSGSYTPTEISVFPNPASSNAQIRFSTEKAEAVTILVFDNSGKTVLQQRAAASAGNNSISLTDVSKLNEGFYTVKMITSTGNYTTKMLIWK